MSEGLPGPGGGAEGGAGRAGVGGDRPHGVGLRRLDEGGAVRRARGSGPLAATDGLGRWLPEGAPRAECRPRAPWLQWGHVTGRRPLRTAAPFRQNPITLTGEKHSVYDDRFLTSGI